MNYLKYFFAFLAISTSFALYGAYYFSNIANIKADVKIGSGKILEEQQLFAKYKINEEYKNLEGENSSDENIQIFETENPELKIIRSSFEKDKNFNPSNKIVISFEKEIDIYSLLGFKKVENGEYLCDGKTVKSEKKAERCNSENKLFITKKGETEDIFKGVVQKSEIDKKTILINTNLEELKKYEIKILKGVKSANSEEGVFSELKTDFIENFATTDKDGNIKEISEETGTSATADMGEIIEENLEVEMTEEEYQEWLKQKEKKVGKQEVESMEKASESGLLENTENSESTYGEIISENQESTSTGEILEEEISEESSTGTTN